MNDFAFKHGPGRVDDLRVIANIGEKGSVQELAVFVPPEQSYCWLGAASIVASGSVALSFPNGARLTVKRGEVLPSIVRQTGDVHEEALEDGTLLYCFQSMGPMPMWNRGFILDPVTPLQLAARSRPSRCILVSGRARCNDALDLNAEAAPHVVKVSPGKALSITGDGVLLYMFEPDLPDNVDPLEDNDPLVDDYMKGLTTLHPETA